MKHQSELLIYTAADCNYSLQAQVLLLSLSKTQTSPVRLIIFGNDWKSRDLKRLQRISNDNVSAEVREVDLSQFSSIKLASKFPLATAYNILAPQYFLKEKGRALYVDADTVITQSLETLLTRQMDYAVSAVIDAHIACIGSPTMWRPWREEAIEPLTPYLNTGVMLIDLEHWREMDLTNKIVDVLSRYELPCVDQDAINIVLRGSFGRLEPRFNSMPYHYLTQFRYADFIETDEELHQAISHPAITHFHRSFLGKPWAYGAIHPGTKMWRALADEVDPRWKRSFDLVGYARRRGAQFARMLSIDSRAIELPQLEQTGSNVVAKHE